MIREVALKIPFIKRDILDPDDPIVAVKLDNPVHQKKWVTVGHKIQNFAYLQRRECAFHELLWTDFTGREKKGDDARIIPCILSVRNYLLLGASGQGARFGYFLTGAAAGPAAGNMTL
jgi:hypothetical protein